MKHLSIFLLLVLTFCVGEAFAQPFWQLVNNTKYNQSFAATDNGNIYTMRNYAVLEISSPNSNFGIQKFVKVGQKCFMVHFEETLVTANLNIDFSYQKTLRFYASPDLAAAVIGALIPMTHAIVCQGFAFDIAHCYPSAEHVNGLALDTDYNGIVVTGIPPNESFTGSVQNEKRFINSLNRFGFRNHKIGNGTYHVDLRTALGNDPEFANDNLEEDAPLHNKHLHSTEVRIKDIVRVL